MNPGRLKNRITIQKKVETEGPFKDLNKFEDYKTIWSEAKFLKGRNFYAARAANIKTDVEFIIRYREDIDETMRIIFNIRKYEIESILPLDNQRAYLIIKAFEIKID